MFDIGWGELLVIGVVALIVIGPKELPAVLRAVGQWTGKIRRMASEFQGQFQEALREAEMSDLKKQVDELGDAARGMTSQFDPLDYDPKKWEPTPPAATEPPAPAAPAEAAGAAAESLPPSETPPAPAASDPASPPSAPTQGSAP
jgi:sec-independent protein translocase protein TatB